MSSTRIGQRLPRRGPVRAFLKRLYYSAFFRNVAFGPVDAAERVFGRRQELVPPRRLRFIGHRGDFIRGGRAWRRRLVDGLGMKPTDDLLDIGCGVGRVAVALTDYISPESGSYEGFDVVPRGIAWCQRQITPRYPNFRFRAVDVHSRQYNPIGGDPAGGFSFPYEDNSFDIAIAVSVFTHMRPDGVLRYLEEVRRVLRPGGRLVATFFLTDEQVIELLANDGGDFALDHELTDASGRSFRTSDPNVPEYNVGLDLDAVLGYYREAGLEPVPDGVQRGWWSGREKRRPGVDYQDIIVARKP